MKRWICSVCDYVHQGSKPPDRCPICDAPASAFRPLPDEIQDDDEVDFDRPPKNLEEVRERARQRMSGACGVYPACDGLPDRLCNREAYGRSIGLGGAGSGSAFAANYASLARLRLRTQLVGAHFEPDTRTTFLGRTLSMPIMGASTSGLSRYIKGLNEREFCQANIEGCLQAGSVSWRGDTFFYTLKENPGLEAIEAAEGAAIPIFKPRAQDALKRLIARAEKAGCPAIGVDLDGCGSSNMAAGGQPVFRKTVAELREIVRATALPVIFKGIMDPDDAERCVEAGAKIVAVSNHGGRVLDSTPGVADVLPAIVERIGAHAYVTADGGVRTGYDVLKMLALGARAVLIGRDLVRAAIGGGPEGVRMHLEHLRTVLARAMVMTGCRNVAAIDKSVFA